MRTKVVIMDLFEVPAEYTLAHCVAADFRMRAGIALQFRRRYPEMASLLDSKAGEKNRPGVVVYTNNDGRTVANIVTKKYSHLKPTRKNFNLGIDALHKYCKLYGVTKLAIPLLGAGLDKLDWDESYDYIKEKFSDLPIDIVVCEFKK